MLMLSITPMDISHVDEICEDLRLQQEQGISDCAMLTAHLEAEGTPPAETTNSSVVPSARTAL